ncbi:ABC transporter permease [Marinihelvus fidelis]|uniref:ABC transporter permease n=1 Tax=Marinihelvus fidelis TaxID=2613842 RepID=A0A5N0T7A2_9GAMM|nr:ABC transporter permease [Marinihelvus fidelis]KAA9130925.1 ABC transporter permease [Marinihelvus fidelis]
MSTARYLARAALQGAALLLGVTLVSFVLMVHFAPDRTWGLLGKNPTAEQVAEVRHELGYDRPLASRYVDFLGELVTLDFGHSDTTGERVTDMLSRTVPVTLALVIPGFILGNVLGIILGLAAAWKRGRWLDRWVMAGSVAGMSLSFLVIIIALQILLCTPWGLDLFPARGWRVDGLGSYLWYVTVPTLALVTVTLGYNARFYRSVAAEELDRNHIRTARAYGASPATILFVHVLRNGAIAILTRVLFSIPLVVVSGSLLLETYFGIPGVGRVTFDAITSGDQPVLKAVVSLTAVAFVLLQACADACYRWADPRVARS